MRDCVFDVGKEEKERKHEKETMRAFAGESLKVSSPMYGHFIPLDKLTYFIKYLCWCYASLRAAETR